MCQRVVDSGHSIKFNNEYYRFINKLGNPIYFNKGTKCTVIKALDGQLFATVDESIFALEKISEVQSKSENFDDIEEVKERKIYIPRMIHPWKGKSFEEFQEMKYNNIDEWKNLKAQYLDALGITTEEKAKQYIEQYLEQYSGIKQFMDDVVENAKEKGYVETLYHRRRYVPELKSNNYMVRQFGGRVAMNTPIQGTAADIMKIAMINVYNKLKENNLKSKLIVQVHDEILVETLESEKEQVKQIVKEEMENVIKLKVPLLAEVEEGYNWYEAK
mgnify:CR=1 FL=1